MSMPVGGTGFKWNTLNAFSNYYNPAGLGAFSFVTDRLLSDTQQRSLKYKMLPGIWVQERVTDTEHARAQAAGFSSVVWLAEGYPDVATYPLLGLIESTDDNHDPESTSGASFYVAAVGVTTGGKLQAFDYFQAVGSPGTVNLPTAEPVILDVIAVRTAPLVAGVVGLSMSSPTACVLAR